MRALQNWQDPLAQWAWKKVVEVLQGPRPGRTATLDRPLRRDDVLPGKKQAEQAEDAVDTADFSLPKRSLQQPAAVRHAGAKAGLPQRCVVCAFLALAENEGFEGLAPEAQSGLPSFHGFQAGDRLELQRSIGIREGSQQEVGRARTGDPRNRRGYVPPHGGIFVLVTKEVSEGLQRGFAVAHQEIACVLPEAGMAKEGDQDGDKHVVGISKLPDAA